MCFLIMADPTQRPTVVETLNDLKAKGYTYDFNMKDNALHSSEGNISLNPDDFEIVKVYRFEGMSDPGDMSVIYVIESAKFGIKGSFFNAYGTYSDEISEDLLKKLTTPTPD